MAEEFREKLYNAFIDEYNRTKDRTNDESRTDAAKSTDTQTSRQERESTPFR